MDIPLNRPKPNKPVRVLHVLGKLDYGGVEVWLMNVLRNIDREAFHIDFAVHTHSPAAFDSEAHQLGANILALDPPRRSPISYTRQLARLIRCNGPYDIVHSHVHFFSGYVLKQSARNGIPIRIAHSHNDTRALDGKAGWPRWLYRALTGRWINRFATAGLACSSWAAMSLFGQNWQNDSRWRVLRYGIDFSKFAKSHDRERLLREMGIPVNRRIVGQIGRLTEQKNHEFSLRVIRELVASDANVHFLIVGGGELEQKIRSQIAELGLSEYATLVGDQQDVTRYLSVMDVMIFPSAHEGLGIVMLEAQAAGVPVVASDQVPEDGIVLPNAVERLSLQLEPTVWCAAIQRGLAAPVKDPAKTAVQMAQSEFAITRSVEQLCKVYCGDYNKL